VYTALYDPAVTGDLVDPGRVHASALQRIPFAQRAFRYLAPFYPAAFESFDLSGYDLVVSSTSSWAKGVRTKPGTTHVCYLHTVSRFVFAYQGYLGGFGLARVAKPVIAPLARWDVAAAQLPTAFIANSHNVAARARKFYGREARVVHGPVDLERFSVGEGGGDYFLVVSRLLPYKRIDLAIEACRLSGARLVIAGSGPAGRSLERAAAGTRTEFLGAVSDAEVRDLMGRARAVLSPGEEDYGLVPLEANASGRPVLAFGRGGALETVVPGVTGEFFEEASGASLARAIVAFDPARFDPARLRAHAETFSPALFKQRLRVAIDDILVSGREPA
jgi:glycosyltransferase involved in cell wall biosynthesis